MFLSKPELFKYFEKLGYSDEDAFVLATLQYGDTNERVLSYILKTYKNGDNFMHHSYNTLKDPETKAKIQKEIDDERRRREEEQRKWEEERKKREEELKKQQESNATTNDTTSVSTPHKKGFFEKVTEKLFSMKPSSNRDTSSSRNYSRSSSKNYSYSKRELMTPNEVVFKNVQYSARAGYSPELLTESCNMASFQATPSPTMSQKELLESLRTDSYDRIEPNRFLSVATNPTSTFRTTYNTASMTNVINNLKKGHTVTTSMVRTEEFLNYMDYNLNMPKDNNKFNITSEIMDGKNGNQMLFLGIQGTKEIPAEQNIVLLLDVSGSMSSNAMQTLVILATLLKKIENGSTVSLVTYSSTDHVIFSGKTLSEDTLPEIFHDIFKLDINGGTYGSAGINMAYEIAQNNYKKDGVNRVIIITDGDLNFGITRNDELEKFIAKKKETGVFFSAIGTGIYNLMDDKLETLAKNGNGNYFVINSVEDANKCLNKRFESLVYPIAVDVKAQVEFNPQKVKEYKLVGYENRQLSHEDFADDTVIAEPFGSGSYAIALYEIVPADGKQINPFKYQKMVANDSQDIATVKIRYKNIGEANSREEEFVINNETLNETTLNAKLAQEVYDIAETLRETKKGDYDKARINLLTLTNNI